MDYNSPEKNTSPSWSETVSLTDSISAGQVFELLPVAIIAGDRNGTITHVNQALLDMTGYEREELVGLSYKESVELLMPPEVQHEAQAFFAFKLGEFPEIQETLAQTRDGRKVPVSVQQTPLLNSDGHSVGYLTIVRDVRSLYEKWRLTLTAEYVLSTMRAAVVAVDAQGTIVLVNSAAEQLWGQDSSEFTGRHHSEVLGSLPRDQQFLQCCLDNRREFKNVELTLSLRGRFREVLVNCHRIEDGCGNVLGACAVLTDVTELKQLQRLSALGQLGAILSHELRNPLTVVKGNLQLLLMEAEDEKRALLASTLEEVQRIESIVCDVHTAAQGAHPSGSCTSPAGIMEQVGLQLRPRARASGALLTVHLPSDSDFMLEGIAPHQFEQVLTNLVNNSIEAVGAEGGQIEIRLARKGSEALVTVTDDGPGIPAEVMPDIFEPFFTTKEAGTGLGLVVCRTLVERAGGSIEVSSVPASGTTFELTFSIRDRECCPDGKIV